VKFNGGRRSACGEPAELSAPAFKKVLTEFCLRRTLFAGMNKMESGRGVFGEREDF
jgi:hypothetical protein